MIHVLNPINFFMKCPPVNSYRSSSSTDRRTESTFLYSLHTSSVHYDTHMFRVIASVLRPVCRPLTEFVPGVAMRFLCSAAVLTLAAVTVSAQLRQQLPTKKQLDQDLPDQNRLDQDFPAQKQLDVDLTSENNLNDDKPSKKQESKTSVHGAKKEAILQDTRKKEAMKQDILENIAAAIEKKTAELPTVLLKSDEGSPLHALVTEQKLNDKENRTFNVSNTHS